jgi:prefoldin subunit 5
MGECIGGLMIDKLKKELQDTIKQMQGIKSQIVQLNKKGEQLTQHCNYLKGKIEAYEEMEGKVNV